MANYLATDTDLVAVADAIRTKGGTSGALTFPGGFVSAIEAISAGVAKKAAKPVVFMDSYGNVVQAYTPAEFAALDALPSNPTCRGLIAQGWNWTLSDAKAYVAKYGRLCIGQMYVTDDGKTRLYIRLEPGRTSPTVSFALDGTAIIDWGDGTATETVTGNSSTTLINTQHAYAAPGDYVVAIQVTSGTLSIVGSGSMGAQIVWNNVSTNAKNRVYQNTLKRVEMGANAKLGTGGQNFYNCYSLESITLPQDMQTTLGGSVFYNCYSLRACTIPTGVTTLGAGVFTSCYGLDLVSIPDSVTSIGNSMYSNCYSLAAAAIPDALTSLPNSSFFNCYPLASVTVPAGVTSLGTQVFQGCNGLGMLRFLPATPPAVSNANTFSGIPDDCVIRVPHGKLSAYTSAANYPSSAAYTYEEDPA